NEIKPVANTVYKPLLGLCSSGKFLRNFLVDLYLEWFGQSHATVHTQQRWQQADKIKIKNIYSSPIDECKNDCTHNILLYSNTIIFCIHSFNLDLNKIKIDNIMQIKKILFLLTLLQVFVLYSQEFNWANSVTGGEHEYGVKAIKNNLGETYFIGYSTGNPFVYEGNEYYTNGRSDAFFAKLDSDKNLVWLKKMGGNDGIYFDEALDIHIDVFGDIYLAIQSVGQNFNYDGQILSGLEAPGQGGGEGVIIKVNADGEYIWHESGTTPTGDNNSF